LQRSIQSLEQRVGRLERLAEHAEAETAKPRSD
jgi:hypothetical protein